MNSPPSEEAPGLRLTDEELVDEAAIAVELLNSLAKRWRFRIKAGRLGPHPMDEILGLADAFERAARFLQPPTQPEKAPPATPERVTAELERSERFRLLVDSIRDYAIFMLDADGRVASWNAGAEHLAGYRAEEILGQHVLQFYTPDDVAAGKPEQHLREAALRGRVHDEGWRVRKDRSWLWAEIFLIALRDARGQVIGFGAVTRDMSERKRAEEALRASEKRTEIYQRFLADATVLLATALEYETTLEKIAHLCVPKLADWCIVDLVENDKISQVAVAHIEPEKEALARELGRRLPLQRDLGRGVVHVVRTGRSEIFPDIDDPTWLADALGAEHPEILRQLGALSYMCVPLHARGRVFGAVSFVRATDGKRYGEEELAQAEELARRAGLSIDNARLYAESQQAIRAREDFLAVASHELRTPLASLQLELDSIQRALQKSRAAELNTRLQDKVKIATRQGARLAKLVEGLLDVTRFIAGRLKLERERFDLTEALRETVQNFSDEARRVGCEVHLHVDEVVSGTWDRVRIEQVIANLLSNALKYGAGKPIDITLTGETNVAVLSIRDQGIGIPPEKVSAIFGKFERAVSLRHYGGLGLGLFVTRQIVEAHGGTIRVESEPGKGATFTVGMPLEPPPAVQEGPPQPEVMH